MRQRADRSTSGSSSHRWTTRVAPILPPLWRLWVTSINTGEVPTDKIRTRLANISQERAKLAQTKSAGLERLVAGAATLSAALDLLQDPEALFRQSTDEGRPLLTQAFFERLYVDDRIVTDDRLAAPSDVFVSFRTNRAIYQRRRRSTYANRAPKGAAHGPKTPAALIATALVGAGSSKAAMVEVAGIEPASFGIDTGLLRAEPAVVFSAPAVTQASCRRAQSLLGFPDVPATGASGGAS